MCDVIGKMRHQTMWMFDRIEMISSAATDARNMEGRSAMMSLRKSS